ncbi:cyclic nucleotide-binding domain-containing protein [Dasania marina]|uniref:cyclic nucleotide-binding domain-containing protein n=1 Tax=Dasania marina TaxID=471499 RepID=UPI0030D98276|tara:strand:- start:17063 stop:18109 length:1047 start_codon:yes stop_codon:yes gene_type:complete
MNNIEHFDKRHLNTLVPVNALTLDHLDTLLRECSIEVICKGLALFAEGDYDNNHVYLLSGSVSIWAGKEKLRSLAADEPECRFPLLHYQPRRETVLAEQDCHLIRFNNDRLDGMIAWDQACHYITLSVSSDRGLDEDAQWMTTLLKSNLFYKVPPMNIGQILNKFEPCYFSAGDTVIRQGEVGDCCYVIKEGVVKVLQSADGRQAPVQVNELGEGLCFGEDALVNDAVRNASIIMASNGVLMRLDKKDFHVLLKMPQVQRVSFSQAKLEERAVWVDVRTQDEYENGHIEGALNMPLNILKLKSRMLDKETLHIVYCNSGRRSDAAAHFLMDEGIEVLSLSGGFEHAAS